MIARGFLLLAMLLAALTMTACGDEAKASDPPDLTVGESTCSRCHMIISDERFASGLTFEDGDPLLYDDLGEMITVIQTEDPHADYIWVHDYDSKEWIDATMAWYVDSAEIMAPMGSGLAVFETREAAEAFAATNDGTVRDWPAILADWRMPMRMQH
ncbi:MAG TPA: nitrous oxide reductase accessory protein NosL [Thermomicrobiales bacterium]|nr:nitrous oxide reductase accessory protein NosL [Thermomicrobiales bacterium]